MLDPLTPEEEILRRYLMFCAKHKIVPHFDDTAFVVTGLPYGKPVQNKCNVFMDGLYWWCKRNGEPQWVSQVRYKSGPKAGRPGDGWFPSRLDGDRETRKCWRFMKYWPKPVPPRPKRTPKPKP